MEHPFISCLSRNLPIFNPFSVSQGSIAINFRTPFITDITLAILHSPKSSESLALQLYATVLKPFIVVFGFCILLI